MLSRYPSRNPKIHRHIGGLENFEEIKGYRGFIHRHIGGLEIVLPIVVVLL